MQQKNERSFFFSSDLQILYKNKNKNRKGSSLLKKVQSYYYYGAAKALERNMQNHQDLQHQATCTHTHISLSLSLSLSLSPTLGWANLRSFQTKKTKDFYRNYLQPKDPYRNGQMAGPFQASQTFKTLKNKKTSQQKSQLKQTQTKSSSSWNNNNNNNNNPLEKKQKAAFCFSLGAEFSPLLSSTLLFSSLLFSSQILQNSKI
jgi:hypothetical protein